MTTFADRVYELGGAPLGSAVPPGGKWFYVDGAHGSDAFDGLTPATAKSDGERGLCAVHHGHE